MRKIYPSDISREEFEKIRPQLESFRKRTKPRTVDLYDVFLWHIIYIGWWLSMANVASRLSQMADCTRIFSSLESI